ncbi:hypothetical protein [Paucibacter sp. DJ2R-2]|uniref:hypothetical protein n=1 Tax=Paucibacter sp. DJ2R-2 TaxID=2893558 RepID=UPI0021E4F49B|nr:hypothetical protein [Paucibacter sp. DJ2R-2]MCV2420289.1 hypothetical protein [Paucibacter sp. DJ4R-1]MCV2436766.1 hypothetical protein [Paucibacter sp. DJ2R-2]
MSNINLGRVTAYMPPQQAAIVHALVRICRRSVGDIARTLLQRDAGAGQEASLNEIKAAMAKLDDAVVNEITGTLPLTGGRARIATRISQEDFEWLEAAAAADRRSLSEMAGTLIVERLELLRRAALNGAASTAQKSAKGASTSRARTAPRVAGKMGQESGLSSEALRIAAAIDSVANDKYRAAMVMAIDHMVVCGRLLGE